MTPLDPAAFIETPLERDALGIWRPGAVSGPVAYPDEGNRLLRQVEDFSWWFGHRNRVILTLVRRFPPSGTLWDIGGGNGVVASYLQENGVCCALLEAGEEGCLNARRRGVQTVVRGKFEDLSFRRSVMEAAGLFDVLEHAQDPDALLGGLRASLAGGGRGRLYLTVPAHERLWSDEDGWAGHFRRFSLNSLLLLLEGNGFHVLDHTFFFRVLEPLIFLGRAAPSRLKRWMGRRGVPDAVNRAERIRRAHSPPRGPAGRFLGRRLAAELRALERGRISRGSSLFAVCEKP